MRKHFLRALTVIAVLAVMAHTRHRKSVCPKTTTLTIRADRWFLNDTLINQGTPAEGLLMNVRMVNAVFEDAGNIRSGVSFNPDTNTDAFISRIPEYTAAGVNAFTISLQGGHPGYEGAVNTAFTPDGALRKDYMDRVEKVIRACDAQKAMVILSCFYQRQHSHSLALDGKKAILNALENTVRWLQNRSFKNVLLEISNEYRHGGYLKWKDGEWFRSEAGQVELIKRAKSLSPSLYVSTSGMGNGIYHDSLAQAADYIIIHFNNTSLQDYPRRIEALKKYGKPILCNEDDKLDEEGANALRASVVNGCGWGYMNIRVNQSFPFRFGGTGDDALVYEMFKNVNTAGYIPGRISSGRPFITITNPGDGTIFESGQDIPVRVSHLYPDTSAAYSVSLLANAKPLVRGSYASENFAIRLDTAGTYILEASVQAKDGRELYRSPKVDIIVRKQRPFSSAYFPPPDSEGGWRTLKDPETVKTRTGVKTARLDEAFEYIKGTSANGGLLVLHDGWLVYERYFGKGHREAAPNLASCGKSFTSAAVGILISQRPDLFPEGLDQKVMKPGYFPSSVFPLSDPRKSDIRLGQLLAFTAGIRGNNPVYVSGSPRQIDPAGPDGWYAVVDEYAAGQEEGLIGQMPFSTNTLWCKPGEGYSYATASIHMASMMLRHITGMELQAFIERHIAKPLGWGTWGFGYKGYKRVMHTPGGGGIALRSTDMLRFGYLLLHEGWWSGSPLIPEDYVRHCSRMSPYNPHYPYSLQFTVNSDGHYPSLPRDAYWKSGSGGHCLYIIPSLRLVVWKLGGRDAQYAVEDTGIPAPVVAEARDIARSGSPDPADPYIKTLELVIAGIPKPD